ncbi:DUF7670 domain-containing protein [Ancylomarina longa]|uniref:DUF7670 domain-containing protein n=1 Tax=Ancylomarina longa TaxID=2487017 RepID=UPI003F68D154
MKLLITILRWIARCLGIFLFLFFIWFTLEIGAPDINLMSNQEIKLFIANMLMLLGLIVVWKFEFIGSIVLIGSYIFFSIVNYSFWIGPIFPTFLLIGLLHFICWLSSTIILCRKRYFNLEMLLH